MIFSDFDFDNKIFQQHGTSRGLSATAELLVYFTNGNLPTSESD